MLKGKNFFAVDLGATSGRTILGTLINGKAEIKEVTRFSNPIIETCGHFYWDIYNLYNEIINGLKKVHSDGIEIESIGIDTWGVDFTMIGKDGELLRCPYSYRDTHTFGAANDFFKKIPRETVYDITGIQVMDINSLYQLHTLNKNNNVALKNAQKILFTPDALSYMLTGEMVTEYTIASTSQMLNPRTKKFDDKLLNAVGLSADKFGRFVFPGEKIGTISKSVQKSTGLGPIPVVAIAGHDTASAVAATPASNEKFAYLSSGTWSLMGIEVKDAIINHSSFIKNYTNEGGVGGTTRFLKNICGMWLLERCRLEWGPNKYTYRGLDALAAKLPPFRSVINPDAPCFANPPSMMKAIRDYCKKTGQEVPNDDIAITRCILDSLALRYKQVAADLQEFSPHHIDTLHVIGGGSQNVVLAQYTSNAVGIPVVAGPSEATAYGNIMIQAKSAGFVDDIRKVVRNSVSPVFFEPKEKDEWAHGYELYLKNYKEDI